MFFLVCDGLKGLPDSVTAVFPRTTVQTCIIHLIRNTFRYASRKYWDQISHDLKPVYTAPAGTRPSTNWTCSWTSGAGPTRRSSGCGVTPGKSSPRSWPIRDVEIRRVLCSTNAIESLNARYRRAVRARVHFPSEQAAMKTRYLVTRSLDPKGTGQTRWAVRWKPALNAFAVTFADRMPAATKNR
ncbi:MAG: transposase [Propionicimonas sp.]